MFSSIGSRSSRLTRFANGVVTAVILAAPTGHPRARVDGPDRRRSSKSATLERVPPDPWPAPVATRPVDAVLELPGSKSVTNRVLVLAALSPGPALLRRPLRSRDTLLMAAGLRTLGVSIVEETPAGPPAWRVGGQPGPLRPVG